MNKANIIGILVAISLTAILFSPTDSKIWILFAIIGLSFGFIWFKMQ